MGRERSPSTGRQQSANRNAKAHSWPPDLSWRSCYSPSRPSFDPGCWVGRRSLAAHRRPAAYYIRDAARTSAPRAGSRPTDDADDKVPVPPHPGMMPSPCRAATCRRSRTVAFDSPCSSRPQGLHGPPRLSPAAAFPAVPPSGCQPRPSLPRPLQSRSPPLQNRYRDPRWARFHDRYLGDLRA